MSAYVEDKAHIDALIAVTISGPSGEEIRPDYAWHGPRWEAESGVYVHADYTAGQPDMISGDALGQMLWAENVRSIQYRYPDTIDNPAAMPGPCDFNPAEVLVYSFPFGTPRLTAADALAALAGYEYQSCEHPGWTASEAYRFCEALRRSLCHVVSRGSSCWSIDADSLATYRATQLGLVTS